MIDRLDGARRPRRHHRKLILRIITYLVLGGVVSPGVAIVAASASSKETAALHHSGTEAEDLRWWNESMPVGRDLDWALIEPRRRRVEPGLSVITLEARATSRETGQPDVARADRILAGWPWPCLEGASWFLMRATSPPSSPELVDQRLIPVDLGSGNRFIPTRPILAGLILDSIVMAAILGTIRVVPSAMRGARSLLRRRAGRCPTCGYPGFAVRCPECGSRTHAARGPC